MLEYWEIFKAFKKRLNEDLTKNSKHSTQNDTCKDIYLQRLGKCLIDAFHTFFIPEVMPLYTGLELIQEGNPFAQRNVLSEEQQNSLSVACGQLCLVTIHLSKCLGISMKHPVIYNTHRSSIINV